MQPSMHFLKVLLATNSLASISSKYEAPFLIEYNKHHSLYMLIVQLDLKGSIGCGLSLIITVPIAKQMFKTLTSANKWTRPTFLE